MKGEKEKFNWFGDTSMRMYHMKVAGPYGVEVLIRGDFIQKHPLPISSDDIG